MLIDVSLVLTLHNEERYLARTLRSLNEAAAYAQGLGITVELVAVLDRATPLTAEVLRSFNLHMFDAVQVIEVDNGSLGPSRNDGCAVARGKYITTSDGDDLISFNSIAEMFFLAERSHPKTVIVPQFMFLFGDVYRYGEYFSLDYVTPFSFIDTHPYISRIFSDRSLFENLKYVDVRLSRAYAYEDWHFNSQAAAHGYTFEAAKDTILFYRQRQGSLLVQANNMSLRQIPPSKLFEPGSFLRTCNKYYEKFQRGIPFPHPVRQPPTNVVDDPVVRGLLAGANKIEPLIEPERFRWSEYFTNANWSNLRTGVAYYEVCLQIGTRKFDDVFLVPFFGAGGAEHYVSNILSALNKKNPEYLSLVIMGEKHLNNYWVKNLPASVTVIDLANDWPHLTPDEHDLITLKIIQSCCSRARVYIRQSAYAERFFNKYKFALSENKSIFFRFSEARRYDEDYEFHLPWGYQFISNNLDELDLIISDNETVVNSDRDRMGVFPQKWQCLPARHDVEADVDRAVEKARQPSLRVLWASRIAFEKRPTLLLEIARQLHLVRPEIEIHAFGAPSSIDFDVERFWAHPNLVYHGAYQSFERVAASQDFLCFVYTTLFDGMPNVVLEAMSVGLPVIAPDIGGIGETVIDGKTGLLLHSMGDEVALAGSYVAALEKLLASPDLRAEIVRNAFQHLSSRHSAAAFTQRVSEILEAI